MQEQRINTVTSGHIHLWGLGHNSADQSYTTLETSAEYFPLL
jgi:hypothetical protein